jgi:hypothetical protein
MSQFLFGSGVFWGTPLNDSNGNAIVNPTPVQLGVMQDISMDISFDTKQLYGRFQFPVAIGRGKGKMTGKAKTAQVNASALNSLFFGQTLANGLVDNYADVIGSAIPATPFAVTVTPPNAGVWAYDLGVRDANGLPMTKVAATPTTGQYTVGSGGVYTFAAADVGLTVYISYQYTATSTTAKKSTVRNALMGATPTFQGDLYIPFNGKTLVMTIPKCVTTKWAMATKLDDFTIPEFDFDGFADAAGNALYWAASDN